MKNRQITKKRQIKEKKAGAALVLFIVLAILIILIIVIAILFFYYAQNKSGTENKTQDKPQIVFENTGTETPIEVFFCPRENCMNAIIEKVKSANKSIDCAFYDLDLMPLINELESASERGVSVRLVVDDINYAPNMEALKNISAFIRTDIKNHQMHNKFCIFDKKIVSTGSMNPTNNCNYKNNNNLVFISSEYISKNYEDEFEELWNGIFSKGEKVKYPKIVLNNISIENYFCPEDCTSGIYTDLFKNANSSVLFMTFSFTEDKIGNELIKSSGKLEIKGFFDKSQAGSQKEYTEYYKMQKQNMTISLKGGAGKLHHKVFIVDNSIVITGSANPTNNGLLHNDENIIVIHDSTLANKFTQEFDYINK